MCDHNLLRRLQYQKQELHCKPGPSCWCAQMIYRLEVPGQAEKCLTPEQIYDLGKDEMSKQDKHYLCSLFGRRLVEE